MSQLATSQDYDPLITATEARKECGDVSGVTFWRWERDGVIPPAIRINKRKYWPRSVIQRVKTGALWTRKFH